MIQADELPTPLVWIEHWPEESTEGQESFELVVFSSYEVVERAPYLGRARPSSKLFAFKVARCITARSLFSRPGAVHVHAGEHDLGAFVVEHSLCLLYVLVREVYSALRSRLAPEAASPDKSWVCRCSLRTTRTGQWA